MSTNRTKIKNKQTHAPAIDSWDFEAQEREELKQQQRHEETKKLNIGDKVEKAITKAGIKTERKTKKNLKKLSKLSAKEAVEIVDNIIPSKVVTWGIRVTIGIYGFIGVICIVLLLMYSIDYFASTVWDTYNGYNYVFLYIIISLCTFGSLIGLYGTFKYGEIDEQMNKLEEQNQHLQESINSVENDVTNLEQEIDAFQVEVDSIIENEHDLNAQIKAFEKLENALKAESKSNNTEIINMTKEVQKLFRAFKGLQIEVEKANLLNLFYELEKRGDDEEGLNREEFEIFLSRLDQNTANKFKMKTFEEMDKDDNGTIDLNEFQTELARIYDRVNINANLISGNEKKDKKSKKKKVTEWNKWLK